MSVTRRPTDTQALQELTASWRLCLSGPAIAYVERCFPASLPLVVSFVDVCACFEDDCHPQVFARVSPDQKALVVECLNSFGAVTLMCGDGTNDVAALKVCS